VTAADRPASPSLQLRPIGPPPARALLVDRAGTMYLGRHCQIYCSRDDGQTWSFVTAIPRSLSRQFAEWSRLACRLLRHEVKALAVLSDGSHVAADRQTVFHAAAGEALMRPSNVEDEGRPYKPPMTITVGPNDRVLWGEYNSKTKHGLPIRLFASEDRGRSFNIARVFEGGDILHIHNILLDQAMGHYWLLAGDHDHEPGIGRLSLDLRDFEWLAKGRQCYRAVDLFDFGDYLIYGTDTEREPNAIMRFDKRTGRAERLVDLPGTCIYSCRFGSLYVVSTSVEPSAVNHRQESTLWISRDRERWSEVYHAAKDGLNPVYFQFGSIVLPRGASDKETILLSGQALKGIDGRAYVARFTEGRDDAAK